MMNIFIMILVALFMVGYYVIATPSGRMMETETEYAVTRSDLRAIAECAAAAHNAKIRDTVFKDVCITQNDIKTNLVCLNSTMKITKCEIVGKKKPEFSYIVTTSAPMNPDDYNAMMEIMEEYYSDAGTFGLLMDGQILSGGTMNKRTVPEAIVSEQKMSDGQLVYMTQYAIPEQEIMFSDPTIADVECPGGTIKTYRFGRWQCIGYNPKTDCGGDMIWDSETEQCVQDDARRPLCSDGQTAVIVDDVWECISPFPEKICPDKNMVARLNYNTLEWECVVDPTKQEDIKKCSNITNMAVSGAIGTTLRLSTTSCTDCEKMLVDTETCTSVCVPDPSQINNPKCYPGAVRDCSGPHRGFYFGFPNASYVTNVTELTNAAVPFNRTYSQNRKFNCMDCGDGEIDATHSISPYTAICK